MERLVLQTEAELHLNTPRPEKIAYILETIFLINFLQWKFRILIRISQKYPRAQLDKGSALFHAMAWRRTGAMTLPEHMMTQFTEVYLRHQAGMDKRLSRAKSEGKRWMSRTTSQWCLKAFHVKTSSFSKYKNVKHLQQKFLLWNLFHFVTGKMS